MADAGVDPRKIQAVFCGNAVEGLLSGQEDIRGQVVMRDAGLAGKPVVNTPNACASASTALREAWLTVASGLYDLVLAVGFEKLYVDDTARTTKALASCTDVAVEGNMGVFFPGLYAMEARRYMHETGATREQFAKVCVKNHKNGFYNPKAQIRKQVTVEEVLNSRTVADPITLYMCSPIGDGGAAARGLFGKNGPAVYQRTHSHRGHRHGLGRIPGYRPGPGNPHGHPNGLGRSL